MDIFALSALKRVKGVEEKVNIIPVSSFEGETTQTQLYTTILPEPITWAAGEGHFIVTFTGYLLEGMTKKLLEEIGDLDNVVCTIGEEEVNISGIELHDNEYYYIAPNGISSLEGETLTIFQQYITYPSNLINLYDPNGEEESGYLPSYATIDQGEIILSEDFDGSAIYNYLLHGQPVWVCRYEDNGTSKPYHYSLAVMFEIIISDDKEGLFIEFGTGEDIVIIEKFQSPS